MYFQFKSFQYKILSVKVLSKRRKQKSQAQIFVHGIIFLCFDFFNSTFQYFTKSRRLLLRVTIFIAQTKSSNTTEADLENNCLKSNVTFLQLSVDFHAANNKKKKDRRKHYNIEKIHIQ